GLEADQRRSLVLVVADADGEAHRRAADAAAVRTGQLPGDIPQPYDVVLAGHTRRNPNAAIPGSPGEDEGIADARISGCRGNSDQHTVADRVGAAVAVDQVCPLEHGRSLVGCGNFEVAGTPKSALFCQAETRLPHPAHERLDDAPRRKM